MTKNNEQLSLEVAALTRKTKELGIPIMIVFEGVPASGKTRLSNELLLTLDAKYTHFVPMKSPSEDDLRYQFYRSIGLVYLQKVISIFILEVGMHII